MLRKVLVLLLAVVFIGSVTLLPSVNTADAAAQCACGKECKCEHCLTGKGECQCMPGVKGCTCGKGCGCDHCKTGKGECKCHAGNGKACQCGKDCKCEHCLTGKGECQCMPGVKGCTCGKGCGCDHCKTGKGECRCHAGAVTTAKPTSDADYARTMKSHNGSFRASYTSDPEAIPTNRMIIWKLKVETADGQAVTDADISVNGDMPEHGHGLPTKPTVTKNLGSGIYLVEGIKFSMPGWWTMSFSIKAGGKTDTVKFNLNLK